jgi:hypothetical protein
MGRPVALDLKLVGDPAVRRSPVTDAVMSRDRKQAHARSDSEARGPESRLRPPDLERLSIGRGPMDTSVRNFAGHHPRCHEIK